MKPGQVAVPQTTGPADSATQSVLVRVLDVSPGDRIVCAGSSLTQRIVQRLRDEGLTYLITETAHPIVPSAAAEAAQYGRYTARYGEIRSARQLLQLLRRAYGRFDPLEHTWEARGRYFDAFRPAVQPNGFATYEECDADRRQHLAAVRRAIEALDVFVFTVGLDGHWAARADDAAYPVHPGEILECFERERYEHLIPTADAIADDLATFAAEVRAVNARARIVLTVTAPDADDSVALTSLDARSRHADLVRALAHVPGTSYAPIGEMFTGTTRSCAPVAHVPDETRDARAGQFAAQMTATVDAICDEDRVPIEAVKCIVWDLDDTIWYGVLLEDGVVRLRDGIRDVLDILDRRGIVHSIASRNDRELTLQKLEELGIRDYFVQPQIAWQSKVESIRRVSARLRVAPNAIAFVDDQPFERDEVSHSLPEVLCIDASDIATLPDLPRMNPRFVTEDSRLRRVMYQSDAQRDEAQQRFAGSSAEFLATLDIAVTIGPVTAADVDRAEELIARTHMLNSTGRHYSAEEIESFRTSPAHLFLMAGLTDKYGPYGRIGLCLVDCRRETWTIELLLMSCRVASRGVAGVLLHHILTRAERAGAGVRASFVATDRNQMMYETFKAAGFR